MGHYVEPMTKAQVVEELGRGWATGVHRWRELADGAARQLRTAHRLLKEAEKHRDEAEARVVALEEANTKLAGAQEVAEDRAKSLELELDEARDEITRLAQASAECEACDRPTPQQWDKTQDQIASLRSSNKAMRMALENDDWSHLRGTIGALEQELEIAQRHRDQLRACCEVVVLAAGRVIEDIDGGDNG